jgi:fatty-acyl-CoA synthase
MTRLDDAPDDRAETIGRPLPGAEVRIVRPSSGDPAGLGEIGELCTRGYHVMSGYFDDPAQTAAAIDPDDWLHTGDLASHDDRGYYRIEGRLKELIIRGGENIYPREIEQLLITHPSVEDVAVVGIPDHHWGEQVAAFIRPAADQTPDEEALQAFTKAHLAAHKVPRLWRFVETFPTTASGKIQKYALRDQLT